MDNQDSQSKWDELARELGAEVPPAEEPQPPVSEAAAEEQPPKPAKPLPTPPKRRSSNWEGLMNELGLEVPEPVEPKEETARAEPPQPPAEPAPPAVAEQQTEHKPSRPRRPAARPSRPPAPPEDRVVARPPVERAPKAATPPSEPAPPPAEAKVAESKSKEDARASGNISLWHRIFGSPEEQAEKIADVARQAEEDAPEAAAAERGAYEAAESGAAAVRRDESPAEGEAAEVGDESADEAATAPKKRRPRRRRRGRGRKGDDQERRPAGAADAEQDSKQPVAVEADEFADEFADDLADEHDEPAEIDFDDVSTEKRDTAKSPMGKPKLASHRSIPSWEETIGVLVDLNMQTRSQRKQSAPSSRGRSRGGRRRRKS